MTTSAPSSFSSSSAPSSSSSSSTCRDIIASLPLVLQRIQEALGHSSSSFILHRSKWQCLVNSYSVLLQALVQLLEHAFSILGPLEQETMSLKLVAPLCAVHQAMEEGERCIQDCISRSCSHTWLLDKALKLGVSTDVVDVHLHNLLWSYSAVLEQASRSTESDDIELDLIQQTSVLCKIWAHASEKDDLSAFRDFLSKITGEEDGDTFQLAHFMLHKLSFAEDFEGVALDVLPEHLWIDAVGLKRNPEILGLGGYGKVHEAVWLGGRFAVKDFFYVEDDVVFGREAAIQARLRHPNVIPLVCCTKNPSLQKCSLLMDLMQHDLRALMMQRMKAGTDPPFSLLVAVDLMLQIAKGVEYLHSLHIMHRDLKSSNILVSFPDGAGDFCERDICPRLHVKIADFGMSKAKQESSKYTTRQIGATIWRAPEVFEINPEDEEDVGASAKYTNKADVYSFALVCYEVLTGKSPFEGTSVRGRVMKGERPTLPPYSPPALSSYIERCWDANPEKRPPFTQICRMLRYFKACILLQDHQNQIVQQNWFSPSIISTMSDGIDDMIQPLLQSLGTHLQPKILGIPLEMHCCRVVFQERDGIESLESTPGQLVNAIATTHTGRRSHTFAQSFGSTAQHMHSKTSLKTKLDFTGWFKKIFNKEGTRIAKSGLRDELRLVGDFTFKELRKATSKFSKVIGEGPMGKVYYGRLVDGREIVVKAAVHWDMLQSGWHAS
eukprot:c25384_g3_i4 orf=2-2167(-)